MNESADNPIDQMVQSFDRALRTLTGVVRAERDNPAHALTDADLTEELEDSQRAHIAGLMRVNHTGEICAQALYEGQALTARQPAARDSLLAAAAEERDHLSWCRERLTELDGRPSVLNPLFYGASFMIGALTGLVGDKVSLGFVEATEDQVVKHLDKHLEELPESDVRSRAILDQMRTDEARHGQTALEQGGEAFPEPVKQAMTLLSRVMTETTYRI